MGGWTRLWIALSVGWMIYLAVLLRNETIPLRDLGLLSRIVCGPPLVVYVAGRTVRWIARGFVGEVRP